MPSHEDDVCYNHRDEEKEETIDVVSLHLNAAHNMSIIHATWKYPIRLNSISIFFFSIMTYPKNKFAQSNPTIINPSN